MLIQFLTTILQWLLEDGVVVVVVMEVVLEEEISEEEETVEADAVAETVDDSEGVVVIIPFHIVYVTSLLNDVLDHWTPQINAYFQALLSCGRIDGIGS